MINHLILGSIRTKFCRNKYTLQRTNMSHHRKRKIIDSKVRLVQQPELEKHMRCNVLTFGPLIIKSVFQTLLHCILTPFWRCWEPGTCVRNQWPSFPKQYLGTPASKIFDAFPEVKKFRLAPKKPPQPSFPKTKTPQPSCQKKGHSQVARKRHNNCKRLYVLVSSKHYIKQLPPYTTNYRPLRSTARFWGTVKQVNSVHTFSFFFTRLAT